MAFFILNVPGRSSSADRLLRVSLRPRRRSDPRRPEAATESDSPRPASPAPAPVQPAPAATAPGRQDEFGETTYSCGCGFVFCGPVVTSVACPHCGDAQAW